MPRVADPCINPFYIAVCTIINSRGELAHLSNSFINVIFHNNFQHLIISITTLLYSLLSNKVALNFKKSLCLSVLNIGSKIKLMKQWSVRNTFFFWSFFLTLIQMYAHNRAHTPLINIEALTPWCEGLTKRDRESWM